MIFFFHLMSWVCGALGILTAFILTKHKLFRNEYVRLFMVIICLCITIHVLIMDTVGNSHENFIRYCVNLEGWEGELRDNKILRFKFLWGQLFLTEQPTNKWCE